MAETASKISPCGARVDTFGVDGSEFLIGFGPLQNPTPQIGYPYAVAHGVPKIGPCPPPASGAGTTKVSLPKLHKQNHTNHTGQRAGPQIRKSDTNDWANGAE